MPGVPDTHRFCAWRGGGPGSPTRTALCALGWRTYRFDQPAPRSARRVLSYKPVRSRRDGVESPVIRGAQRIGECMTLSKDAALELLHQQIDESCNVKRNFSADLLAAIVSLVQKTARAYRAGNKVLLMGNGGSAADAQHIAAELVGRFRMQRKALAAIALTTDTSILTAISNDFGFEDCFARQVEALGRSGDIVLAISTSGRSANILKGVAAARAVGCYIAALTGKTGGDLAGKVDSLLAVPSAETPRIQEAHSLIAHMYCDLVERELFEVENSRRPEANRKTRS
jgi:D-sedoheptulose 7-phosphate isomerase